VTPVEDSENLGHPLVSKTDENMDQMKEFVLENRRITVLQVANMLEIMFASVQNILKDNLKSGILGICFSTMMVN
jgi:predicted HTH transcriptional regulator